MSINNIMFRGGESLGSMAKGGESIGSMARGGNESVGSVAKSGGESVGSVAKEGDVVDLSTSKPNFRGNDIYYVEKKKNHSAVKFILGTAVVAGATIAGLGYAHKAGLFDNVTNKFMKKICDFMNPAAKKCHSWCSAIKDFGVKGWEKIKNLFHKKN